MRRIYGCVTMTRHVRKGSRAVMQSTYCNDYDGDNDSDSHKEMRTLFCSDGSRPVQHYRDRGIMHRAVCVASHRIALQVSYLPANEGLWVRPR